MAETDISVLDLEALKGYLMVETKDEIKMFLKELVPIFKSDTEETLKKIVSAINNNNVSEIRAQAHSLKSCAKNLALKNLANACQELESAAMSNQSFDKEKIISSIGKHRDDAVVALTELVS
jgi:HPt (histidine-containing phosphotransfer) domain-containing protein